MSQNNLVRKVLILVPIVQMKKLRFGEVEDFPDGKWQNQGSKAAASNAES